MPAAAPAHVLFMARAQAPERNAVVDRTGSAMVTQWAGKMPPSPCYAQDNVWKRLRLNAKQIRHHLPATAASPRKGNWRKPSISLMMPSTGSTVHLRALEIALPSAVLSLSDILI